MAIKLTWLDRNPASDGTRIYRSDQRFDHTDLPAPIATVGSGVATYTDSTTTRGRVYYYRFGTFFGDDEALSEIVTALDLPYTGPGPQKIQAGDHDLGLYGEVSAVDFFTGEDLALITGVTEGTLINSDTSWLKMSNYGKILYIAKMPIRRNVSWGHLYNAGLVYGTNDGGITPLDPPVNQRTVARRGLDAFAVRLMTGGEGEPTNVSTSTGAGSEWNRLLYPLSVTVFDEQEVRNFKTLSNADFGLIDNQGYSSWCQESGNLTGRRVTRASYATAGLAVIGQNSITGVTAALGWRPVLEYLPDE